MQTKKRQLWFVLGICAVLLVAGLFVLPRVTSAVNALPVPVISYLDDGKGQIFDIGVPGRESFSRVEWVLAPRGTNRAHLQDQSVLSAVGVPAGDYDLVAGYLRRSDTTFWQMRVPVSIGGDRPGCSVCRPDGTYAGSWRLVYRLVPGAVEFEPLTRGAALTVRHPSDREYLVGIQHPGTLLVKGWQKTRIGDSSTHVPLRPFFPDDDVYNLLLVDVATREARQEAIVIDDGAVEKPVPGTNLTTWSLTGEDYSVWGYNSRAVLRPDTVTSLQPVPGS